MKILYNKTAAFAKGTAVALTGNVTVDSSYRKFQFRVFDLTNAVVVQKESAYEDVSLEAIVKFTKVDPDYSIGLSLARKTDLINSENMTFQVTPTQIKFFHNGGLVQTDPHTLSLENKIIKLTLRRRDNQYILYIDDVLVSTVTRQNYKQNTSVGVFGHNVDVKIFNFRHYTEKDTIKFAIMGDSMSNNSYLTPENTLKGKIQSAGYSIGEFSGDANIVKDGLDAIHEVLAIKPKYAILLYGENDIDFATGNLLADLTTMKSQLVAAGITPIFCTVAYSTAIDVNVANTIIRDNFFATDLNLDLQGLLVQADTTDGVHPTAGGVIKMANAIIGRIQSL